MPEATPAAIHKLLRRCLEKDRKERMLDIAVARFEIKDVHECQTRLAAVTVLTHEPLINWGYAICDAAMRKHVVTSADMPRFPYEAAGICEYLTSI